VGRTAQERISAVQRFDPVARYGGRGDTVQPESDLSWQALRTRAAALVENELSDVYHALLLLGESTGLRDVCTPIVAGQGLRAESETFKWWQSNKERHVPLRPLEYGDESLPRLPIHPPPSR